MNKFYDLDGLELTRLYIRMNNYLRGEDYESIRLTKDDENGKSTTGIRQASANESTVQGLRGEEQG